LPLGMQTFRDIIEQDYLYIDKTREIYELLARGGKYYFLSRPRRFGKSLLVSTLAELFSGRRDLFKGLWIEDKIPWTSHPVIHIDFLGLRYGSRDELIETLEYVIAQNAAFHGIKLVGKGYDQRFRELISGLSKINRVVILVDEYDKPIIDFLEIDRKDIAAGNQEILRTFYSVIKGADKYLGFVFLTGVSRFSRMSIFSGLNNLDDITVDDRFSTLLGVTHSELPRYFDDRLDTLSQKTGQTREDLLASLKKWYNGYSWDGKNFLYNPFSLLSFFSRGRFGNYWFSTGTPTFLINRIKNRKKDIASLERVEVDEAVFESYDLDNLEIISMLFQTGYLTIKEMQLIGIKSKFTLSYPNEEVRESFLKHFLSSYTNEDAGTAGIIILELQDSIKGNNLERFFDILKSLFASIPANLFIKEKEAYYHTVIYLILRLLGIDINVEVHTNKGRIDAVIETERCIFVMEFKMGAADKAISQIETRKYYERYLSTAKTIKLVGVGFDPEERNISTYFQEEL